MTVNTSCPDAATLHKLRAGQLPDPYASEVRQHLAACPICSRGTAGVPPGERRLKPAYSGAVSAEAARRAASGGSVVVSNVPRRTPDAADGGVLRPPEQPGEIGRLAGYRVLRLLGQDGGGYVFEAEHVEHRVKVALQVVPPGGPEAQRAKQRLLYGGAAASAYEVGQDRDVVFVATALPDAAPDADLPEAPLVAAPLAAPVPARPKPKRYCPRCLADLKDVGGKEWCAKCGYSSDDDEQQFDESPESREPLVPFWVIILVFGCGAILAATLFRREFLPAGSTARVWWVLIEAGAGLALYFTGHILIVVLIFRQWRDGELFKYIDPLTVTRYAFEFLPKTRWGICMMAWGLVAFFCAFALFWMNEFAFKDRKEKRRVEIGSGGVLMAGDGTLSGDDPDAPEYVVIGEATLLQDQAADVRDVELIDLYGTGDPPERAEPPNQTTCVVIGYVPDPNDPGKVGQLVLGTRSPDGSIRYAGTVNNFARTGEVDQGLGQVKGLKPLLETPGYMPASLNAIPVEPSLVARVGYKERDAQGVLKSATVKGVGRSAPDSPPDGPTP
jgi:hypothetical protein